MINIFGRSHGREPVQKQITAVLVSKYTLEQKQRLNENCPFTPPGLKFVPQEEKGCFFQESGNLERGFEEVDDIKKYKPGLLLRMPNYSLIKGARKASSVVGTSSLPHQFPALVTFEVLEKRFRIAFYRAFYMCIYVTCFYPPHQTPLDS